MDWRRWIIERLPERLRVKGMMAVCMVLTVPIRVLHEEFVAWQRRMRTKVAGTPQVCVLQKIVKDELGLDVLIEEGDGKPTDFIIKTAFVDVDKERRLFALLDRYKLAGKSYGYKNAEVKFSYEWAEYVCEQRTVFVQWSGYVCERKYRPTNHIKCNVTGSRVTVTPEFAPTSELIVTIDDSWWQGQNWIQHSVKLTLPKNSTIPVIGTWQYDTSPITATIDIKEDNNYIYEIQWV